MSKAPDKSVLETIIPLLAGGTGGTAGAIVTCPLEVVKTRLQSSNSGFPSSPDVIEELKRLAKQRPPLPSSSPLGGTGSAIQKATPAVNYLSPHEIAAERRVGPLQTSIPVSLRASARSSTIGRILSEHLPVYPQSYDQRLAVLIRHSSTLTPRPESQLNVFHCLRFIYLTEGVFGLFKGLGPNLMGVAPSRGIYFWAYSTAKRNIDASLPKANRDTPFVHVVSAMSAGFSASTTTNPIWLIKTRLQLDRASGTKTLSIRNCVKQIYSERGLPGFWRGVTASYWGISETVIHFVIYEALKKRLASYQNKRKDDKKTLIDFAGFMLCGACSKFCATCIAYPHEVARTRLREQGGRYKSFWQTLGVVYREEGRRGLYRGLGTQLMRQIPNAAIMMATYELTVYVLTIWLRSRRASSSNNSKLASDLQDASNDAVKSPTSAVR